MSVDSSRSESRSPYGDRFQFTERELDPETALRHYRARCHDATSGRWTHQDPVGFAAGDANLCRSAGNGPTNATDLRGTDGIVEADRARKGVRARKGLGTV